MEWRKLSFIGMIVGLVLILVYLFVIFPGTDGATESRSNATAFLESEGYTNVSAIEINITHQDLWGCWDWESGLRGHGTLPNGTRERVTLCENMFTDNVRYGGW